VEQGKYKLIGALQASANKNWENEVPTCARDPVKENLRFERDNFKDAAK
jgi:hypothetical protein